MTLVMLGLVIVLARVVLALVRLSRVRPVSPPAAARTRQHRAHLIAPGMVARWDDATERRVREALR